MKEIKTKIDKTTGCQICISHKPHPSGYVSISGECGREYLHRYIYRLHHGEIPQGLVVRHTCDNRACVNPDHLTIGTQADNIKDKVARNRQSKGINRPDAKLNDEQALFILNSNLRYKELATMFCVSLTVIKFIKTRRTWKHIQKLSA